MLSESVLLALQRATHHTLHALSTALASLDLTSSEINTLANLADGRARSVRELATDTGTRSTTLTGVLDRLERRGYVARELDPDDRRSFRISLTGPGRAVARKVGTAVTELETTALAGVSARQLAGYHAVVSALEALA
ncbi:MAG TPA: MarR family transcriptional regulator [Pseudonocardiaceae bacterium]|nr:MarR family transcriptional regulator [Pseudonocardiaceae bacterium]